MKQNNLPDKAAMHTRPCGAMALARTLGCVAALLALFGLATLVMSASAQADNGFVAQIKALANSPRGLVAAVHVLHSSGGRVGWSKDGKWIAMDRKGADGYYDLHILRPNGAEERCITCTDAANAVLARGHHGQPAWHPSGRYIVFQAQKATGVGHFGRDIAALSGTGHHSDLWLADLTTGRFHQLTQTAPGGDADHRTENVSPGEFRASGSVSPTSRRQLRRPDGVNTGGISSQCR